MNTIIDNLTLTEFLNLLSLDTKIFKMCTKEQLELYQHQYNLIHAAFTSSYGSQFTKMFRSAVIGKCSSLNGVIINRLNSNNYLNSSLPSSNKVFVKY